MYGPRTESLALRLPREQFRVLERLARQRGVSVPAAAREVISEALAGPCRKEGARLSVTLGPREAEAFAALGQRHGLGPDGMLEVLFAGLAECPAFVEGHLVMRGKARRGRG